MSREFTLKLKFLNPLTTPHNIPVRKKQGQDIAASPTVTIKLSD